MALAKRISAIGVAAADVTEIRQLLEQGRARGLHTWLWSNEPEADVVIIDVDSVYGHMDWIKAQAAGRKILCLSVRAGGAHDVTLLRPVSAKNLIDALASFGSDTRTAAAESPAPAATDPAPLRGESAAPAVVAPTPVATAVAPPVTIPASTATAPTATNAISASVVEPALAAPAEIVEASLIEYCSLEALPQASQLARPGLPALSIDAGADCYYGPPSLKALAPYCRGVIGRDEWQPLAAAALTELRAQSGQPLTRLVWLATLLSSHGHLLAGLDVNARFRLTRWPPIEREFPKHFRIGTVMMKGPATLTEISDQSGSALADVIDFVNAYAVIGVAEMEGVAIPPTAAEGGLLSRLRNRVRRS